MSAKSYDLHMGGVRARVPDPITIASVYIETFTSYILGSHSTDSHTTTTVTYTSPIVTSTISVDNISSVSAGLRINTTDCPAPSCTILSSTNTQMQSAILPSNSSLLFAATTDSQPSPAPVGYAIGSSPPSNSSLTITMSEIATSTLTTPTPASSGGIIPPDDPYISSYVATVTTHGPPLITGTNSRSDLSVSTTDYPLGSAVTSVSTEIDHTLSTVNISPTASASSSASPSSVNEGVKHRGKARLYTLGMVMIVMSISSIL